MKTKILLLLLMFGVFACQNDKPVFDSSIPKENISFKSMDGGAVMYYQIPTDSDIFSIHVTYQDAFGHQVVKERTYMIDSIILDGFSEPRTQVPVWLSFRDKNNVQSSAEQYFFDTKASATYAFFDKAKVSSFWNGFMLEYESPDWVDGFANVFYIGMNSFTGKEDTLLLKTFQIEKGRDTLYFPLEQEREKNTVIIKTEDFKGNIVRQQIWADVLSYFIEKMDTKNVKLLNEEVSRESQDQRLGWKYLFDGDILGTQRYGTSFEYTFIAGPNGIGKSLIFDLNVPKIVAKMRLYGYPYSQYGTWNVWYGDYSNHLPNQVTIFGSDDPNDDNSWKKLGYYYESPVIQESSWAWRTSYFAPTINSYEDLLIAKPCYMEVPFTISDIPYRYYKVELNSVFSDTYETNRYEDVTIHELEIYTKKN